MSHVCKVRSDFRASNPIKANQVAVFKGVVFALHELESYPTHARQRHASKITLEWVIRMSVPVLCVTVTCPAKPSFMLNALPAC